MSQRLADQTYYQILEVSPDAPEHEIHRAYELAKQTYSPDSPALYTMFTPEEAEELRNLIEEAYLVLGNRAKRTEYNQKLGSKAATIRAEDLPDFELTEETGEISNRATPSRQASDRKPKLETVKLPDGFARTPYGVYEIDPDFESEISQTMDFDGTFLQRVRLYKTVSLDQMAAETRISRTYLAAIEANNYNALPAPVFVRGFVVQVARILGLPEQKVASSYMEILKKG